MTGSSLTLRRAVACDQPLLSWLGTRTYRDHFNDFYAPDDALRYLDLHYSAAAVQRDLQDPDIAYWIAEAGSDAVGFAKTLRRRQLPLVGGIGTELQKLYFLAGQTGHGYGKALIEHVTEQARIDGADCLWLHVLTTNAHAQRFYARRGFDALGVVAYRRGDADVGMWVMRRALGGGR